MCASQKRLFSAIQRCKAGSVMYCCYVYWIAFLIGRIELTKKKFSTVKAVGGRLSKHWRLVSV